MKIIITKIIKNIKKTPGPSPPSLLSTNSSEYLLQIDGGELREAQNSDKISSPKPNLI